MRKPLFIFKDGYLKRKQNTIYFQESTQRNIEELDNIEKFDDNHLDNCEDTDSKDLNNQNQRSSKNINKKYIPFNAINEIHIFSNRGK